MDFMIIAHLEKIFKKLRILRNISVVVVAYQENGYVYVSQ